MRIDEIRVSAIEPNPWNPNRMDDDRKKALVKRIRKHGILQPLLVRPLAQEFPGDPDATYQILDGEHRYDALRAAGVTHTEAVIVEDVEDDDAKLHTLAMNQIRGRPIPMALAALIVDLEASVGRQALEDAGFTEPDFEKAHELAGPIPDDDQTPEALDDPKRFEVTFTPEAWAVFSRAMQAAKNAAATDDDATALLAMAQEFIATYPM